MFPLLPMATLGYAVGVVLADQGWIDLGFARTTAWICLLVGLWSQSRVLLRTAAALVTITACGALAMAQAQDRAGWVRLEQPRDALVEGTVCKNFGQGSAVAFDLCDCTAVAPGDPPVPRRLRVFESLDPARSVARLRLPSGQRIRARLRLTPIRMSANPGARHREKDYARRGIGALASVRNVAMLVRISTNDRTSTHLVGDFLEHIAHYRESLGDRLAHAGRGGGLARALVLGDRSTLSHGARDAFAKLGIGHLLAVSGLHVALVAGIGFAAARWLCLRSSRLAARRDPRSVALGGAFAIALVYAALSGWGIPVRRALLFLGVVCMSVASRRSVRGEQLLSLAALPLLIFEPHALFEMGAQLSFVASAGLLLARGPKKVNVAVIPSLVRTSATAIAATAPWVAWHGGGVGVWGVATNLVAVPWIGLLLLPSSLVAAFAAALPQMWASDMIIDGVARLGEITLDGIILLASVLPASPIGTTPCTGVLMVALAISFLALRARSTVVRVLLSLFESALLAWAPAPGVSPSPPRVVSFDVGQGDATLIQGRTASLLIDAGRALGDSLDMGRRVVIPGLAALDVARLDLVIASHADLDHRGGLDAVLDRVPVGALWLPHGTLRQADFRGLLETAKRRGIGVRERGRGDPPETFGDLRVTPLWPSKHSPGVGRNDKSLVVVVEVLDGGQTVDRILLPGDLGVMAERRLLELGTNLRAAVLKVGHHGSRGSSSLEFLAAVQPRVALVSAPCHGRGGLPSEIAMERLSNSAEEVFWTGESGALIVGLQTRSRARVVNGWHRNIECWKH
jgi:competence protein ComEC